MGVGITFTYPHAIESPLHVPPFIHRIPTAYPPKDLFYVDYRTHRGHRGRKSTLARSFERLGIPVLCSDTVVHTPLATDPAVCQAIHDLWPEVFVHGKIDRFLLGEHTLSSPDRLRKLGKSSLILLLRAFKRSSFQRHQHQNTPYVVLDLPLLFEVGLHRYCHYVVLALAPYPLRKQRVLRRKGMSLKKFALFGISTKCLKRKN